MSAIETAVITEPVAERYRAEFPIFEHTVYLNSCSLGPFSKRTEAALAEYASTWSTYGAPAWWKKWLQQIDAAKERFARLIGAEPQEVTVAHSISSALSSVASAFDYTKRPNVVCADLDFPTIPYQWLAKKHQGVHVRFARSSDRVSVPLEQFESATDDHTALVATSHVFYTTGAIQPVRALADLAHARGAKLVVDGYHSVGTIPVDVKALDVDIYVGGVLKWLLGGPGLTFIYVRKDLLDELLPTVTGWFASDRQFDFNSLEYTPARTADRFQLGTPSMATVYTGVAGMEMILEATPNAICDRLRFLTSLVVDRARDAGFHVMSPYNAEARGGIVMLQVDQPEMTVQALANRHITVDYRPGLVRVSPHFYNTVADVTTMMDALEEIQQGFR